LWPKRIFDHIIYVYGSTITDETGLILTFAHELQHFIQYGYQRRLWAANLLLPYLPESVIRATGLRWFGIPAEREARITAKRVGTELCGAEAVAQYIDLKIKERVTPQNVKDWELIQQMNHLIPYDLQQGKKRIFYRLREYKRDFQEVLDDTKDDPDFKDLDLSLLIGEKSESAG